MKASYMTRLIDSEKGECVSVHSKSWNLKDIQEKHTRTRTQKIPTGPYLFVIFRLNSSAYRLIGINYADPWKTSKRKGERGRKKTKQNQNHSINGLAVRAAL